VDEEFSVVIVLAFNIKKKVCDVFDFFLSFVRKYGKKQIHNMLSLMLDL
jgi:hypothetical protein